MRIKMLGMLAVVAPAFVVACGGEEPPPPQPPPPPPPVAAAPPASTTAEAPPPPAPKPTLADLIPQTLKAQGEAFNAHDAAKFAASYTADAVTVDYGMGESHGRDEVQKMIQGFMDMSSDAKGAPARVWVKGNTAVVDLVTGGTMTGDFMGMKASKKPFGHHMLCVATFSDDGLISGEHVYGDGPGMMAQLKGAKDAPEVPAMPSGAPEMHFAKNSPDEDKLVDFMKGFNDTFNKDDAKALSATIAPDAEVTFHFMGGKTVKAGKDLDKFHTDFLKAIPKAQFAITNAWGIDGVAIVERTITGKMTGKLGPVPPTNKDVTLHVAERPRSLGRREALEGLGLRQHGRADADAEDEGRQGGREGRRQGQGRRQGRCRSEEGRQEVSVLLAHPRARPVAKMNCGRWRAVGPQTSSADAGAVGPSGSAALFLWFCGEGREPPRRRDVFSPRGERGAMKRTKSPVQVVEVTLVWGHEGPGNVLGVHQVERGALALGERGDVLVPEEILGADRFEIVRVDDDGATAYAPAGAQVLVDRWPSPERSVVLELGKIVRMRMGSFALRIELTAPGDRTAAAPLVALEDGAGFVAGSALFHAAAFAAVALFTPPLGATEEDPFDADRLALIRHLMDASAQREDERLKDVASPDSAGDSESRRTRQGPRGRRGKDRRGQEGWPICRQGDRATRERRPSRGTRCWRRWKARRSSASCTPWRSATRARPRSHGAPSPAARTTSARSVSSSAAADDALGNGGLGISGDGLGGGGTSNQLGMNNFGGLGHTGLCTGGPCGGIGKGGGIGRRHAPVEGSSHPLLDAHHQREAPRRDHPAHRPPRRRPLPLLLRARLAGQPGAHGPRHREVHDRPHRRGRLRGRRRKRHRGSRRRAVRRPQLPERSRSPSRTAAP